MTGKTYFTTFRDNTTAPAAVLDFAFHSQFLSPPAL